jgi:hypothetical protein
VPYTYNTTTTSNSRDTRKICINLVNYFSVLIDSSAPGVLSERHHNIHTVTEHLLCADNFLPSFRLEVFLARVEKLVVIPAHEVMAEGVGSYAQDVEGLLLPGIPLLDKLLAWDIDLVNFLPSDLLVNVGILVKGP